MKRFVGAIFVLAGAWCLFQFAARGTWEGRESDAPAWKLPLVSLGQDYPKDGVLFLGALWGLGLGLALLMRGSPKAAPAPAVDPESPAARYAARSQPKSGGTVARILLLNACLALSMLFLAYIGAKSITEETKSSMVPMIGVFFGTGLLQIALGLILWVLAIFEKPKGVVPLLLGTAVYLGSAAVGVLAFLWGA